MEAEAAAARVRVLEQRLRVVQVCACTERSIAVPWPCLDLFSAGWRRCWPLEVRSLAMRSGSWRRRCFTPCRWLATLRCPALL